MPYMHVGNPLLIITLRNKQDSGNTKINNTNWLPSVHYMVMHIIQIATCMVLLKEFNII